VSAGERQQSEQVGVVRRGTDRLRGALAVGRCNPEDPAVQMVPNVLNLPGNKGRIESRVYPGMPLPSCHPRGEVIGGAHSRQPHRRAVHTSLEHLIAAVTEDRGHVRHVSSSCKACAPGPCGHRTGPGTKYSPVPRGSGHFVETLLGTSEPPLSLTEL
jgi:hypothetical protein